MNRELQLHILELADVLVGRPSQYAKRIGDISSIFKNLHHLLNSLRPHQVKEMLFFTACFRRLIVFNLLLMFRREQRLFILWSFRFNSGSKLWRTLRGMSYGIEINL